jgi:hypothetical protein
LDLDKALLDALRMNKIRCADLLIEYGASFDRLRSLNRSKKLYEEVVSKNFLINDSKFDIDRKQMYCLILNVRMRKFIAMNHQIIGLNHLKNTSMKIIWILI